MKIAKRVEFRHNVDFCENGQRLDILVADRLQNCSRSFAAQIIRQGYVLVDGRRCKPSYKVKSKEQIIGQLPTPQPVDLIPESLDLDILYEDHDVLVINKPAGMVVHPAAGHDQGTLVHGILHHCPDLSGIGLEKRPGIVHRLDKETSGVILIAKNTHSLHHLARQFKERWVEKKYFALVHGEFLTENGEIDLPIGRHPSDRKKMSTHSNRPRHALSLWRISDRFADVSLLEIIIKTGRTHQIRVHCHAIGHPIVGDSVYRSKGELKRLAQNRPALFQILKKAKRQMLHAFQITFIHPTKEELQTFQASLAEDMADMLKNLRALQSTTPPESKIQKGLAKAQVD